MILILLAYIVVIIFAFNAHVRIVLLIIDIMIPAP